MRNKPGGASLPKGKASKSVRNRKSAKPQKSPEELIKIKYNRLFCQLRDQVYLNALKTCQQILNLQPANEPDPRILETQAKILIKLDRYSDSSKVLDKLTDFLTESETNVMIHFLRCYCLYKLGDHKESFERLKKIESQFVRNEYEERIQSMLEAQILYKLEDFTESKRHYIDLLSDSDPSHPEYQDLDQNLKLICVKLDFIENQVPKQIENSNNSRLSSRYDALYSNLEISNDFFEGQIFHHKEKNDSKKSKNNNMDKSTGLGAKKHISKSLKKANLPQKKDGTNLSTDHSGESATLLANKKKMLNRWKPKKRKKKSSPKKDRDLFTSTKNENKKKIKSKAISSNKKKSQKQK